ncbi:hypothetical protein DAPPUDRAFT_245928 [Daphnia pulex]|uniref:Uncharacterized protein n=1 Tax=Daphnia pulex TaxID=6669 RepID=E9GPB0_DAPPU|nr:hypothetical protein DAPPUDRAFT_245928 [Daphnia pulex]|eukprot:EFX78609.1 hypothetical protein DAPPUDRAFT_245928 [Daphnia pulex]
MCQGYIQDYILSDEPIEMSGRYDFCYSRNGQLTLFVNRMLNRDAGTYEEVASNPFGVASRRLN